MTPEHRDRTRLLDTLALLAGFDASVAVLPDGRVPDVVRISFRPAGLFIGDAKHADQPGSADTYLRLRRYACWGDAFLARPNRFLTIALATPATSAADWLRLLLDLADDVGLPYERATRTRFGSTSVVGIEGSSGQDSSSSRPEPGPRTVSIA